MGSSNWGMRKDFISSDLKSPNNSRLPPRHLVVRIGKSGISHCIFRNSVKLRMWKQIIVETMDPTLCIAGKLQNAEVYYENGKMTPLNPNSSIAWKNIFPHPTGRALTSDWSTNSLLMVNFSVRIFCSKHNINVSHRQPLQNYLSTM